MKTPLCNTCLPAEVLCETCTTSKTDGSLLEEEIQLSRALLALADKHPALERAEVKTAKKHGNILLITVPRGTGGHLIGRKGAFVSDLSETLGLHVKVVEENMQVRQVAQKLLYPARLGDLRVGGTDNEKTYKIQVPSLDKRRVPDPESLEKVFTAVLGGKATIVWE